MKTVNRVFRRFFKNTASQQAVNTSTQKKTEEEQQPCFSFEDRCIVRPTCGCPKIVIVGGGIAGLSAAERLVSCGLGTITLLEAAPRLSQNTIRLGGRVMSCWIGDKAVELGCGSVGGGCVISNPLFSLALAVGDGDIGKVFSEKVPDPTYFFTAEGNAIKDTEAEELLFMHIFKEAASLNTEKTSLLHFLTLRIQQELLNYPEEERYNAERVLYGMVNELRGAFGGDLSNVSAPLLRLRRDAVGSNVVAQQGLMSILAPLVQAIPYHRIFQQKEVTKIDWREDIIPGQPRASVYTADWDCFEADYVIVTFPFGVMKEKAASMFDPPLPASKLEAIGAIGCGVMNKIYVEYTEPWWGGSGCRIRLAWSPQEILHQGEWTRGINLIQAASRTVMEVRTNGAESMMLEQCSEEEVALELTRFFRKLLCDSTIPFPHHIVVTRWGSNPHCKGSFMSLTLNSTEEHLEELPTPVPSDKVPVILFAGDSTVPAFHGNIMGARLSGIREADRILDLTRHFNGPPQ